MSVSDWVLVAVVMWAAGASGVALWFARETRQARRQKEIAVRMASHAVKRLTDAEAALGGKVVTFAWPNGCEDMTTPLRSVSYWLN